MPNIFPPAMTRVAPLASALDGIMVSASASAQTTADRYPDPNLFGRLRP